MTRDEVFDRLIMAKNAERAIIVFSGGGDEGGVDSIEILDADSNLIESLSDCGVQSDEDLALSEELIKPIYDRYDSFDGEPYVSGEVVWDCRKKTVTISGTEEVTEHQYFRNEV